MDREARTVTVQAVAQGEAFRSSLPPDHQYHLLVSRHGSAAPKALFVTDADDREVARALRELGARDAGGVPLRAWTFRWVPFVPFPDARAEGSRVEVRVTWDGAGEWYELEDLLEDPGGRGVDMRFGGGNEHDEEWDSGCVACLFSCPGGIISNARYTIRDHQRRTTEFDPGDRMPPDGTVVTMVLEVGDG